MHNRITRSPSLPELDFAAIRTELGVPGPFPPEVLEAAASSARSPRLPDHDATALDLVTIDPPGARDLDQAVAIEARNGGWRVFYAIADLAAFVQPGDPVDREARNRTQTYYSPDRSDPLHPPAIGAAAASLLPDGDRPAVLWTVDVESDGTTTGIDVRRAMVRSRAQLTYAQVQTDLDAGRAPSAVAELPALGAALMADAARRGAIELGLPEQEVVPHPVHGWTLALRSNLDVEEWNAQISLLTGRAAASLMLEAGVGLLRTVPAPDPQRLPRLRDAATAMGVEWRRDEAPGEVLARLDMGNPRHAALADLTAELLRGAGYTRVEGTPLADPGHAGVGAPYAHVTAPLRRLVDRFGTEVCLALAASAPVPPWVEETLAALPDLMRVGDSLARTLDRTVVDATEAFVLRDRVGEVFPAAVLETGRTSGTIVIDEPAVRARCNGNDLPLGDEIHVRCTTADVRERAVRFERVS